MPSDTVIKQQLNSLLYVRQTCESRIQRLRDGVDEPDVVLPGVGPIIVVLIHLEAHIREI